MTYLQFLHRFFQSLQPFASLARANQRVMASSVGWMVDEVHLDPPLCEVTGWALAESPQNARFLLDDRQPETVSFPHPSPDVGQRFWALPEAGMARFTLRDSAVTFDRGHFIALEFQSHGVATRASANARWYLRDPRLEPPLPPTENVGRVINGPSLNKYVLGGTSLFGRFQHVLSDPAIGPGLSRCRRILDWGCGAGRLTRYLLAEAPPDQEVWGADVDSVNVDWCRSTYPDAHFEQIPLLPPTLLPDGFFDLIIGVSVLTHLREAVATQWLHELRRIAAPGALLLLTTHGPSLMALNAAPGRLAAALSRDGMLFTGVNPQLSFSDADHDQPYYVDVCHSHDFIRSRWGQEFDVVDILDGVGLHQDLVILRRAR